MYTAIQAELYGKSRDGHSSWQSGGYQMRRRVERISVRRGAFQSGKEEELLRTKIAGDRLERHEEIALIVRKTGLRAEVNCIVIYFEEKMKSLQPPIWKNPVFMDEPQTSPVRHEFEY